jgi:hypothetical protein
MLQERCSGKVKATVRLLYAHCHAPSFFPFRESGPASDDQQAAN